MTDESKNGLNKDENAEQVSKNAEQVSKDSPKTEPAMGGITGGMKAVLPPLWERYSKEEFM